MTIVRNIERSLLHLFFPHCCCGCGTDLLNEDSELCLRCLSSMQETQFHMHSNNPVEKIFWGRIPLACATAQYYFTKDSLMQRLMHALKYRGNRELGLQLGRLMGLDLSSTNRFRGVEALVPLPLFPSREKKRGYNQASLLCIGMSEVMNIPLIEDAIIRPEFTESQTSKGRLERWKNMDGKFLVVLPDKLHSKHLLLVDDVVTTGATLEACGQELLSAGAEKLSIATLCYTAL